ncbi:MAG TPA: cysteine desulfurase [Thermoplasmata archaeon]|nr:cysteine desulfurase [Thermoplasmata archaeon]
MKRGSARRDFPALRSRGGRPPPIYLDSACMSLVPRAVLDAMSEYYQQYPGCAGRSFHRFAEEVSHRFEGAREEFHRFLHTPSPSEVVFVRNSTEALNLVGQGLPWKPGERVVVTDQEHNSNLVLWQRLREERGIKLDILKLPDAGGFDLEALDRILTPETRLVSLFHTSNLDGRSLPIAEIAERVHARGARLLVDGCQAAPHLPVDLARLGADYYAISGHKMLGPTGTGILAARAPEMLRDLRPLLLGGETVEWSTLEGHELRPPPHRFEAGLQNYAGFIGAGAAVRFLTAQGLDEVRAHDRSLNALVTRELGDEPRLRLLGPSDPSDRPSIFAFSLAGIDPNDAALFLDEAHRVLLRSGMHCVHSWYKARGLNGNLRASFYLYNNRADARALVTGVRELLERIPASPPATAS